MVDVVAKMRGEARAQWLDRRIADAPRCPVARYVRGCIRFDGGRAGSAVRDLMIAYHADASLESAALLVFAGLKDCDRKAPILGLLRDTWEEFRRPEFDRRPRERLLLDAFDEPFEGIGQLVGLPRKLWRLPIASLRAELRSAAGSAENAPSPMLRAAST